MNQSIVVWLLSSLLALPALASTIEGWVVGISDGDTITVLDSQKNEHKIRLAGIDAPEKSQPYGQQSKQHLSDLVFGKVVTVEWNKIDRYGRTIGKVLVQGTDANLRQVQAGMAWHYKAYEKEQSASDRGNYAVAETKARTQRGGLWADANPIPPWDFRQGTVEASTEARVESGEQCPCGGTLSCTGPRGGKFCTIQGRKKKYL